MKGLFQPIAYCFSLGILFMSSCKKENPCTGCPTGLQGNTNIAPVAYAGLDQVINLPKDSVTLYGSASYDPDGKIKKWKWTKISGPSNYQLLHADSIMAKVKAMEAGIYQFELTVTDSMGLNGKDTVKISVNGGMTNEVIFDDQIWECWWECWITIPNIYNYIPQGAPIQVFIKREGAFNWMQAFSTTPTGFGYGFYIDNGSLVVYVTGSSQGETDKPDIKVVY